FFFFSSRRRHTRLQGDWSSDVCSSDLASVRQVNFATRRKATTLLAEIRPGSSKAEPAKRRRGTRCRQRCDSEIVGLRFQKRTVRSEERRVGKECRSRGWRDHGKKR